MAQEDLSVTLADRLRADDLDLALVSAIAPGARRGLTLRPLASERLLLIVARDHPAVEREAVSVRDLRDERFVAFPEGATIGETVAAAAAGAGFEPRVAFESNDIARTRALVAQGLGLAVLPESDIARPGPDVAAVRVRGRMLVHHVAVAWREGGSLAPAPAEFLRVVVGGGV